MIEYIIGFIQGLFGCERGTAVEIINIILGIGLGMMLFDITESLKRIADNGEKK